jgi:hypothetical protein
MMWLWIAAGLVTVSGVAVAVLAIVGSRLPKDHVASRRITLRRAPAEVFAAMRELASASASPALLIVEEVPPRRLVTRIADETLPYGGTWTYDLEPDGPDGTRLVITERGFVNPPVFRTLSRYVFTHHRTLDTYLRVLGARLG